MTAPNPLPIRVEAAPGADPRGDPDHWDWVDITGDVRVSEDILITFGVREEGQHADPVSFNIRLNNRHGRYTPANPLSPYYGKLGVDTPVRVLVDWPTTSVRATGYAVEWPTRWDQSGRDSWVPLRVAGEKRRLLGRSARSVSALTRHVPRSSGGEQELLNSNPTFEAHAGGWQSFDSLLVRSTEQAFEGMASGKWIPNEESWQPVVWTDPQAQRVIPGRRYKFRLWIRPTVADLPLLVFMDWFPVPGGGPIFAGTTQIEVALDADVWTLVEVEGEAPKNANGVRAGLHLFLEEASETDVVFFDEATLIGPQRSHVVAHWSLEDEGGREFASNIPGARPGTVLSGPVNFRDVEKLGSERLPTIDVGASFELPIPAFRVDPLGDGWRVDWLYRFPAESDVMHTNRWLINLFTAPALVGHTGSTVHFLQWRIRASDTNLSILAFGGDGAVEHSHTTPIHPDFFGRWLRVALRVTRGGFPVEVAYTVTVWNLDTPTLVGNQLHHVSQVIGGSADDAGRPTLIHMPPYHSPRASGHYVVSDNADVDPFDLSAYNGFPAEPAGSRIVRLCEQERVPVTLFGADPDDTELTGPQPVGTLLALLRQAADVDGPGLLTESGEDRPSLAYRIGRSMLAQEPALTLAEGQLSRPPQPTDDDQRATNQVIAKSSGGTRAIAGDDTPRRSVEVERNPAGPNQLRRLAEREIELRAGGQLRWPEIEFSLIAHPDLAPDWLAFRLGDRVIYDHEKSQIPGIEVDLIAEGGTERIGLHHWNVTLSCRPVEPWMPALFGDDESNGDRHRWDTEHAVTFVDFDAGTDTSLSVVTVAGPLWTTDGDDLPLDIFLEGGVALRVTGISGTESPQTFTVEAEPINGVSKLIPAGARVHLHRRPKFAL